MDYFNGARSVDFDFLKNISPFILAFFAYAILFLFGDESGDVPVLRWISAGVREDVALTFGV